MKIGSFEFNLRELSGSMGDFGTLFPLAIGYIAVCGLDPAGLLITMGLANIVTGLVYGLPMPIEPMKVLAVVAIAQQWSPSMIYASAFGMGIVWVIFAATGLMNWVAKITPRSVVRGIQVSLGALLAFEALKMLSSWWLLGIICVGILLLLRENRWAPGAVVVVVAGIIIMYFQGHLQQVGFSGFRLPGFTSFRYTEVWQALLLAGFAQIPLTATNAVLSTSSLISQYWPDRKVSERKLSLNMGIMNLLFPFFGGMPLCHGAGGLAGQYYYGARTGGANILEGTIEILLGLLLASSIAVLFAGFPTAIIGSMMFLVGVEMIKFSRDLDWKKDLPVLAVTLAFALIFNMAYGYLAGLAVYYTGQLIGKKINARTGK